MMDNFFDILGFQDAMRQAESQKTWYDKAMDIVNTDNDSFLDINYVSNLLDDED